MGLATFIRSNEQAIVAGWLEFAETYVPSAEHMDRAALTDHVIGLLQFIVDDLEIPETEKERSEKAKGQGPKGKGEYGSAADTHANLRFDAGFDTLEMISEFRALRASVIKLWRAEWTTSDDVLPDLLRFNEAIDQIMTESLSRFVQKWNLSGSQIIVTLSTDIRDPLLAMHESAQRLLAKNKLDAEDEQLVSRIVTTSARVNGFVSDVIDALSIPLGRDGLNSPNRIDIRTSDQKGAKKVQATHHKTDIR